MKIKFVTEEEKQIIIIQCHHKINYGFISKSGKSFVFRVDGAYLKANGEIIGKEGAITGYMHELLNGLVVIPQKKSHYHQGDLFKYDFGDGILRHAIKIPIVSYKG